MKRVMYKTVHHFFPEYHQWLKSMKDPRNKNMATYGLPSLMWVGTLLFLLKLGARRQINYELDSEEMIKNVEILSKEKIYRIPHDGTLEYLMERLDTEELNKLRTRMINELIRKRCLEKYRLKGYYLIAIDGSGYLTFKEKHCEHCLKVEKDGKALYYKHPILEAKLVLGNGMAFSIETEFVENPGGKVKVQDCELRAFHRLIKKLKRNFPQLKICLLLDGLYANKPVIGSCNKNNWNYIITFKEGSMKEVYKEYESLKKLHPENYLEYNGKGIQQEYCWAPNVLQYKGTSNANVLECIERKPKETKRFVYLTNFSISKDNVKEIGGGGRLRWKIENEGFNTQKNGGYKLEHHYSEHIVALKNFYLLLQIAHIINQLMEKGSLLVDEVKKFFGSIRNLSRRLLESLRTSVFNSTDIQAIESSRFQIRLQSP